MSSVLSVLDTCQFSTRGILTCHGLTSISPQHLMSVSGFTYKLNFKLVNNYAVTCDKQLYMKTTEHGIPYYHRLTLVFVPWSILDIHQIGKI